MSGGAPSRRQLLGLAVGSLLVAPSGCGRAGPRLGRVAAAFVQPYVAVTVSWPAGTGNPTGATAVGSGWFAGPGRVVTAAHVVTPAVLPLNSLPAWVLAQGAAAGHVPAAARGVTRTVGVLLPGGRRLPARVAAYGQPSGQAVSPGDVAVLDVADDAAASLPLGSGLSAGEAVWILGARASGAPPALTPGLVRSGGGGVAVLSAALGHGASGAAVLGRDGRVHGILVAISAGVPGLAWAVPAGTVRAFLGAARGGGGG